jgi:hypothetical protein
MKTGGTHKPAAVARRARPGRARRWVRRGLEVGVVAIAVGWFVQSVLLPWLIRDKVTDALAGLGFVGAAFEVRSASFWNTRLAGLTAAGGDLAVGSLDVSYRPLSAASGELDVIRVGGAEVRLTIRNGKVNLGPPAGPRDTSSTETTDRTSGDASLPFARLEVASSALRVDWDGREFWLPVSGTVDNRGDGAAGLELHSFAFGSPLEIAGTLDLRRGTSHVTATAGQVDLAALLASVPETLGPVPVRAGGRAGLSVVHDRRADSAGGAKTTVTFTPTNVWATADAGGRAVSIDGLSMDARVVLDDAFDVTSVGGRGSVAAVRVGDQRIRDVALAVTTEGERVAVEISARGEAWRVDALNVSAAGLLGARPGQDVELAAAVGTAARIPREVLAKLSAAGVDAAGLGEARVEARATATLGRSEGNGWRWSADVPKLQLTLPAGNVAGPGGAKLTGLAGVLNLGGKFGPDGGNVSLLEESWIGFGALDAGQDDAAQVAGARIALTERAGAPLANVKFAEDGVTLHAAAWAESERPLALSAPGIGASVGRLLVGGTVVMEPGTGGPRVAVRVEVADAGMTHAASGLSLGGISAGVPITVNNAQPPSPGTFEVATATLGKQKLEPLHGTLAVADGRAAFTAKWAALPEAVLDVAGWVAAGEDGPAGEVVASVPSFTLTDADALADRIPALDGWAVTGTFAAGAKLQIAGGRVVPRATLTVAGADAASTGAGVNIKGLAGRLTMNSFAPLATPGGQRVTARELAFGDVRMTDASLAFRVEPDAVQLERVEAGWLGGRVFAHGVRLDPADPNVRATLYAEGLSLKEILAFAAEGRATGDGVMFGKLPVHVDWPRVRLGRGYLRSQTPAGDIQVLDTQLMAETMERSDPRFLTDPDLVEVKDRVVRALTDFEYDALTFDFDEESGGLVRIHTHGRGRAGERPQELDMTLNVRGANDLLNHYLQMTAKWDELSN